MFVEVVRLLIVLFATIAGHEVGSSIHEDAAFTGAAFGAALGYVGGGIFGRALHRQVDGFEVRTHSRTMGEVLTAGSMAVVFGLIGGLVAATILVLVPSRLAAPGAAIVVWVSLTAGARLGYRRSGELLAVLGLSPRPLAKAARLGERATDDAMLVDTSVIIDGRILAIARAGFVRGQLLVPRFVIDELQGIADAQDPQRRRRGRRGLELLDALGREPGLSVRVLDDEVPEISEVDAKLVALARRLGVGLITLDKPLAKIAELQGVTTFNLMRLAEGLRPDHVPGDVLEIELVKTGTEPGQAVGFLPDTSMVVVSDAAHRVGDTVAARIGSEVETAKGRIFFAVVHEPDDAPVPSPK